MTGTLSTKMFPMHHVKYKSICNVHTDRGGPALFRLVELFALLKRSFAHCTIELFLRPITHQSSIADFGPSQTHSLFFKIWWTYPSPFGRSPLICDQIVCVYGEGRGLHMQIWSDTLRISRKFVLFFSRTGMPFSYFWCLWAVTLLFWITA